MTRKYVTVDVSADDIKKGTRGNMNTCPLSLAFKRLGYDKVSVDFGAAFIGKGESESVIILPRDAASFVENFDAGKKVEPISFVIRTNDD